MGAGAAHRTVRGGVARLGKWYDGLGKELFGHTPSFKQLSGPHAKVHSEIHKAVSLLSEEGGRDDRERQIQIIAHFHEAEQGSNDVMELLDAMMAEKHGDKSGAA